MRAGCQNTGLLWDNRAVTTLEMALIFPVLILMTFAIIDMGNLQWAHDAVSSAASLTARCGAAGMNYGTSTCTSTSATQSFAAALQPSLINASDVTVTTYASSCLGATGGSFIRVDITSTTFAYLPNPYMSYTVSASACYPM